MSVCVCLLLESKDYGSNLDQQGGRSRVNKNNLDQFYDYNYRRVRKPRVPLPDLPQGDMVG